MFVYKFAKNKLTKSFKYRNEQNKLLFQFGPPVAKPK